MVRLMNSHSVMDKEGVESPIPAPINDRVATSGLAFIQR